MANIKSAKKRIKTSTKNYQRNVAKKSEIKTAIKKFLDAVEQKNLDTAKQLFKTAEAKIARAANKGFLKRNTASRKISRLAKRLSITK